MGLLRLYFALAVLMGHLQVNGFISPTYAVQGFYIISGFYMSFILNEKYNHPALNLTFYKKRFVRLLPTYWLIAFFSLAIALFYYYKSESSILFFDFIHIPANTSLFTWIYIIVSNIIIWGQDLALFLCISPEDGELSFSTLSFAETFPLIRFMLVPVAWSVSTEFTFYFSAPFILRNRKKTIVVLFVLSAISNIVTNYYGLNNSNWRFRFFPSVLLFFLAGHFAYLLYKKVSKYHITINHRYFLSFLSIFVLTAILNLDISFMLNMFLIVLFGIIILPLSFHAYKYDTIDRTIGEMSYPLYLIHPLFIGINDIAGINNVWFVIATSLLGAFLCYRFYILPIEKFRSKIV